MMKNLIRFQSIHDYHKFANLRAPEHPLVSLIDYTDIRYPDNVEQIKWTQDYYVIGLKKDIPYKFFYGQQAYDFDQGVMTFIAPNQVMSLANNPNREAHPSGWLLLIHPDFLWNSPLGTQSMSPCFFRKGKKIWWLNF